MNITISSMPLTLKETLNTYTLNLAPIKSKKEFSVLIASKYGKKSYLVFPKADTRITPESIQDWCNIIVRPVQVQVPEVKIIEFYPNEQMNAYQALVQLPGKRRAFYTDLRNKDMNEELSKLFNHIKSQIIELVGPTYKLVKEMGSGNFCDARAEFMK